MTARNSLLSAAQGLLPARLPSATSFSGEELDLRFLETSESLVLALMLDPDAPYYLARMVASEAVQGLRDLVSQADAIISVLQSPTEELQPPSVDRQFQLAEDALQRVGSRVAVGAAPEEEDLNAFIDSSRTFARLQLVPQENSLSLEAYRTRLADAVNEIDTILETLLPRLRALDPASFFVDNLTTDLPKSKQLGVFVKRMQDTLSNQRLTLDKAAATEKISKSSNMLAETSVLISLAGLLNNLSFLRERFRLSFTYVPVTTVDGQIVAPGKAAVIEGVLAPYVLDGTSITVYVDPSAPNLDMEVDRDSQGDVVASVSVALPVSTGPVPVRLASLTVNPAASVALAATVVVSGVRTTYSAVIYPIPTYANMAALTGSWATGDHVFLLDPTGMPGTLGPNEVYRWNGVAWVLIGGPTVTLSAADAKHVLEQHNATYYSTTGVFAPGPLVTDIFDIDDSTPGELSISIKPSVGWVSVGTDINLRVDTQGTDQTAPICFGPLYASGTGSGTVATGTFTDLSASFVTDGVQAGHYLRVLTGPDAGVYEITNVTATQLQTLAVFSSGAAQSYEVTETAYSYSRNSRGYSPTLNDVVSAINYVGSPVEAAALSGRRISITSKTVGTDLDSDRASYIRVVAQPEVVIDGNTVPALGLPYTATYGSCSAILAEASDFFRAGAQAGMLIKFMYPNALVNLSDSCDVVAVPSAKTLKLSAPAASIAERKDALLYAKGSLSYSDEVESNSSAYAGSYGALIKDTSRLRDVLGQTLGKEPAKLQAVSYVKSVIGSSGDVLTGPAEALLSYLDGFTSPESVALVAAVRLLRERGFDQSADLLLLGDVHGSVQESNASYAKSIRDSIDDLGRATT